MEILTHIIYIYLIINSSLTWFYLGEYEDYWVDGTEEKKVMILSFLILMIFGSIIYLGFSLWRMLRKIWGWLDNSFLIIFWCEFYFTTIHEGISVETLASMNRATNNCTVNKTMSHWMIRRAQKAINYRNNYFIHFKKNNHE